jgi:signal peptidase I
MSIQQEEFLSHQPLATAATQSRHTLHLELAAETLRQFSEVRFVAHGTSMLPTLYPGDCLTVKSFGPATPRRGDIVLCRRANEFRVHRIVGISNEGPEARYVLRGDALPDDDPPVSAGEILGRVTSLVRRGQPFELNSAEKPRFRVLRSLVRRCKIAAALLGRWHAMQASISLRVRPLSAGSAKGKVQCT